MPQQWSRPTMLKAAFAIPGLVLAAAIVWAFGKADFWASVALITANPWGVVTLIDLYAGFIMTGVLVAAVERWRPWVWALMAVSFVLGNVVYALWAVVRGAALLREVAGR
jgi:cytochrome b subunit of formate dehydrogenase